jgi:hypothetical protein
MTQEQIAAMIDLVRNVAATDNTWLARASEELLRQTIIEFRQQARDVIDLLP